ncbi:MAG: hypothetical protein MZV63_21500 [Marinilabiliales bacterium]|nr:hypothetical protein [Marinilabiliales bacterium]
MTLMASCEKNVIEYDATTIGEVAEFQLHYIVPVTAVAANNVTKVEINNQLYANSRAPLNTYNAIPSGVGRSYTVNPGTVNIKMYQGTNMDVLVYDQSVTMTAIKQNLFVHDFTKPPVVIDNEFPYIRREVVETDTTTWVKFYNFLYETAGVPTTLKLQYQYISHRTGQVVNVGAPVAFGQTTGWQQVLLLKLPTQIVTDGTRRIDYRIKVVDDAGNIVGDLMVRNSSGVMVPYADFLERYNRQEGSPHILRFQGCYCL